MKDAVDQVTVIPENRSDMKVEIIQANPRLPLEVRNFAGRTIVDGDLRPAHPRLPRPREQAAASRGVGDVGWRTCRRSSSTRRATWTSTPAARSGAQSAARPAWSLGNAGCGDWTVGNVEGPLRLSPAGSGDTHAGVGGRPRSGSPAPATPPLGDVRGPVRSTSPAPATCRAPRSTGPLDVHVAGSGDVKVGGGRATACVSVTGSGDVNFCGIADSLKARVAGLGDVRARQVTGPVSKTRDGLRRGHHRRVRARRAAAAETALLALDASKSRR